MDYVSQALGSLRVEKNETLCTFFSQRNFDILQKEIAKRVKRFSGHDIDRQSDDSLYVIMQYVYSICITESRKMNKQCSVQKLNEMVIQEVFPMIIENINAYFRYIKDSSSQPVPMGYGEATSIKGENSLSNKIF